MAFTNSNDYIGGRKPMISPAGSENVTVRFPLAMATADLALNVVGQIGVLPAGCVPVAIYLDSDDLDSNSSAALVMSIGVLNAGATDLSTATDDGGAVWAAGVTVGQAGGMANPLSAALARVNATQTDRKIGIKVTTASATAAAGNVGLTMVYRAV